MDSTWIGAGLTPKYQARLERIERGNWSGLFGLIVSAEEKSLIKLTTGTTGIKFSFAYWRDIE